MKLDVHTDQVSNLDEVRALVRARLSAEQRAVVGDFVERYYSRVDPEDIAERSSRDLFGAALSHWNFARERVPGEAKLRVFNPSLEEDGWQSTHTIVEIINDDMPFLVDSVIMEVNGHGLTLHLVIHPIISVVRSADGSLIALGGPGDATARGESFMHVEVDRVIDPARLEALANGLRRVLGDVRAAVMDWKAMSTRLASVVAEIESHPPPIPPEEFSEGKDFLHWLGDNHFTFLGYRAHDLVTVKGEYALRVVPGSSLGILRGTESKDVASSFAALPPAVRAYASRPELLVITKSTARSTVHRPGYLDYIAVKRFDAKGEVSGEHRFLGLFTSTAYNAKPSDIPLLRRKAADIQLAAGFAPDSHAGKELVNILETYPRDELFQITESELLQTAMGILHLGNRQRFRLFVRRDPFERFLSCLIYAPRENYSTELRQKWQDLLVEAFAGTSSEFYAHVSESVLARVLIIVRTRPGSIPSFNVAEIEARLARVARRWHDDLKQELIEAHGEARGNELFHAFANAFPAGYRDEVPARVAVEDIELMSRLSPTEPLAMRLYRPTGQEGGSLRFKMFKVGAPVTLSDSLPMLERMGLRVLDEHPHRIAREGGDAVWLHDFGLERQAGSGDIDIEGLHAVFEDAFARVFRGDVENDDFNRLVMAARVPAQEIVILRAYAKYMRQIGFTLSQSFIESTLANNAAVAAALVQLFKLRFDPALSAAAQQQDANPVHAIEEALGRVESLSEDRVLRQYLALIQATTRTNYWRTDAQGRRRSFLSFKFDPAAVPGLPDPRPMFEIFVYSTRFEGVHLRGGKVARGGLRWSDRPEDFRTEVLGLMKAQMVKNVVIVPVGSKGGFVLKRAPSSSDREAFMKEGVACYQDYLRALLDITDNRVGDAIVPPPQVRRHDPDDPYLVVAADKGTATFSDYANGISQEYGFWLGDAFASGGSAGYDHKAMGITARGAWESVKRHFREMGIDTQTTDFTVAGIGDMSGDVFGNGMLLSRHIKLVAAFDHRHIFLDPDPQCEPSFVERERLFKLPRSSWADYDAKLLSPGGGIYPRSAKSIPLSGEVRRTLSISAESMTPTELVNAILKAPVDLLYNGGIGTYVKASSETHVQVGDRANDTLRVNGRELRCKVVGEGGNLGCTQLGRIEYAMGGGRIFTDAIDNSAGVDTSDHEVNIKILLGLAISDGTLAESQRNGLLAEMTDEVAALVLRDNTFQTQSLSVTGRIAPQLLDAHERFVHMLEKSGRLNRAIEFLPSDEVFTERRKKGLGLTAPERAVLLAYSKIWIYDELVLSSLPDDAWVATALVRYFPNAVRERYRNTMARHPLKREIIATHVTNSMVNRVGSTFVHRLMEMTGAKCDEVVRAYLLTREIFGFVDMWQAIEALDNVVPDAVQTSLLLESGGLIDRGTTWFLRSRRLLDDMGSTIAHFAPRVEALAARLPDLVDTVDQTGVKTRVDRYATDGVPRALAERVVALDTLYAALDIVEVADATGRRAETVAEIYFDISTRLGVPWLRDRVAALPGDQHWEILAKGAMFDDLSSLQRTIAGEVLTGGANLATRSDLISAWQDRNRRGVDRAQQLLTELRATPKADASMLAVALRELRNLG